MVAGLQGCRAAGLHGCRAVWLRGARSGRRLSPSLTPRHLSGAQEDVKEECGKYGSVVSAKIKPTTAGFIYMKFTDQPGATACVAGMTGRWFAGKQISAGYVPEAEYESA